MGNDLYQSDDEKSYIQRRLEEVKEEYQRDFQRLQEKKEDLQTREKELRLDREELEEILREEYRSEYEMLGVLGESRFTRMSLERLHRLSKTLEEQMLNKEEELKESRKDILRLEEMLQEEYRVNCKRLAEIEE